jgi:GntR family transcriptional repressor for pyruvate dehydrogenase complex
MRMSLEESHISAPMGGQGVAEHRQLAEAIQARNVEAARTVMTEHLGRTAARVRTHAS